MNNLSDKFRKDADVKKLADKALKDKKALLEMLESLLSEKKTKNDHCGAVKYNCLKALWILSEDNPEVLYPKWDFFVELFDNNNTYLRFLAVCVIANLTKVDTENKFEKTFNRYYKLLRDKSTIVPAHVAGNSGKIAKANPKLQTKITSRLLSIDKVLESKQKDLVGGYTIEAFSEYFKEAKDKKKIIEFVKKQLKSKSPRTRKKAKEFLKKWEKYNLLMQS